MINKIKKWYKGENKVVVEEDDPDSGVSIWPYIVNKKHWTSKIANVFVTFYLKHWKWLWGMLVSVFSLIIAFIKLFPK